MSIAPDALCPHCGGAFIITANSYGGAGEHCPNIACAGKWSPRALERPYDAQPLTEDRDRWKARAEAAEQRTREVEQQLKEIKRR